MEYLLGFAFGLGIFQALFMRDMVGGSYSRALAAAFIPELTSMNCLMAGMIPVAMVFKARVRAAQSGVASVLVHHEHGVADGIDNSLPMNCWLVAAS